MVLPVQDGRRVATLLDAALPAARHAARWRGCDDHGRPVAAGTYLYRLEAGPWIARHRRMLSVLDRCERAVETLPPVPWLADHLVVEMRRASEV